MAAVKRVNRAKRPEPRVLTDPRAIKALAHPARLTVLEALGDGEELTATACAELTGISASAMSYHLRALEKWGFVERADNPGDGRERPWRVVPGGWAVEGSDSRVAATAADAVVGSMLDGVRGDAARWFAHESEQPSEWRRAAVVQNRRLWLTADELAEFDDLVRDFVDKYADRSAKSHPDSARRVRLARISLPVQFD